MRKILLAGLCIIACSASAFAVAVSVPEIDASSLPAALALLGGGILIIRTRFGSK
jgi:hypothetical protein